MDPGAHGTLSAGHVACKPSDAADRELDANGIFNVGWGWALGGVGFDLQESALFSLRAWSKLGTFNYRRRARKGIAGGLPSFFPAATHECRPLPYRVGAVAYARPK